MPYLREPVWNYAEQVGGVATLVDLGRAALRGHALEQLLNPGIPYGPGKVAVLTHGQQLIINRFCVLHSLLRVQPSKKFLHTSKHTQDASPSDPCNNSCHILL